MKRPQIKFHVHTIRESYKLLGQKSQNLSLGQNLFAGQTYLAAHFFPLHQYFIETTTTDIVMLVDLMECNIARNNDNT